MQRTDGDVRDDGAGTAGGDVEAVRMVLRGLLDRLELGRVESYGSDDGQDRYLEVDLGDESDAPEIDLNVTHGRSVSVRIAS
jgi:hypothetical protein